MTFCIIDTVFIVKMVKESMQPPASRVNLIRLTDIMR